VNGLPHGAQIDSVVVYGSVSDETWELVRAAPNATGKTSIATANLNTVDTSIANAEVDLENFVYGFISGSLDTNDEIWGAIITYTLEEDIE